MTYNHIDDETWKKEMNLNWTGSTVVEGKKDF